MQHQHDVRQNEANNLRFYRAYRVTTTNYVAICQILYRRCCFQFLNTFIEFEKDKPYTNDINETKGLIPDDLTINMLNPH